MLYKILVEKTRPELEDEVRNYLNNGWEPIGSVSYNPGLTYSWVQAIIKRL